MDTSVVLGLAAGGLLLAVANAALVRTWLLSRRSRTEIDQLRRHLADLQRSLNQEAQARQEAERRLASRMQLTATRRATLSDELTDGASGLGSEGYFTVSLAARVASARRHLRPLAVVLVEAVEDLDLPSVRPADPASTALAIRSVAREADTVCRLQDGVFALLLEDSDEQGAVWMVERVRRTLAASKRTMTTWAGVACYPAHALEAEAVLDRADMALDAAREWRQDRIEVADAVVER